MDVPIVPENEKQRLHSLFSTNLLNTLPEPRFDRYTYLAARLFNMPMSLVSLVDQGRQWVKSSSGTTMPDTDRNISFCAHTILQSEPLIVNDARSDHRFADNPLVTNNPGYVFYAGFPVRSRRGDPIGTLSLIDQRPRHLTRSDIQLLHTLSKLITAEVSNHLGSTTDSVTRITSETGFRHLANYCCQIAAVKSIARAVLIIELIHNRLDSSTRENQELVQSLQTLIPTIVLIGQLDSRRLIALEVSHSFGPDPEESVRWLRSDSTELCVKTTRTTLRQGQLFSQWYQGFIAGGHYID